MNSFPGTGTHLAHGGGAVLEMTDTDEVDLRRIAGVVQMDQALVAKVLLRELSFYGLSRPCGTVRQAMVYLGLNTVRTRAEFQPRRYR